MTRRGCEGHRPRLTLSHGVSGIAAIPLKRRRTSAPSTVLIVWVSEGFRHWMNGCRPWPDEAIKPAPCHSPSPWAMALIDPDDDPSGEGSEHDTACDAVAWARARTYSWLPVTDPLQWAGSADQRPSDVPQLWRDEG